MTNPSHTTCQDCDTCEGMTIAELESCEYVADLSKSITQDVDGKNPDPYTSNAFYLTIQRCRCINAHLIKKKVAATKLYWLFKFPPP